MVYRRYVDDNNIAARKVAKSVDVKIDNGVIEMVNVVEGEEGDVEDDEHTAKVYKMVADQIRPKLIKMVEDFPSNHDDKMLLILDMKVQVKMGILNTVIIQNQWPPSLL